MRIIEAILKGMVLIGIYLVVLPIGLIINTVEVIYTTTEALIWDLKNIGR